MSYRLNVLLLTLLLTACGGGGDSSGNNTGGGTTLPPVNVAPVADAGSDQTVAKGTTVALNGNNSFDADGDSLAYNWTITAMPANSAAFLSNNTLASPTFVADLPGNYLFSLAVSDGTSNSTPDTISVIATNSAPLAHAGNDNVVDKGFAVILDGSQSSDLNGDPLTYSWSLDAAPEDSIIDLSNNNDVTFTFIPSLAGMYQFSLTVNDGAVESVADSVSIEAINTAPTADAGSDIAVITGSRVILNGSNSTDFNGDPLTFLWQINNQPAGSTATLSNIANQSPSFIADVDGNYSFDLTVNDGTINSMTDSITVSASTADSNTPPVANAGEDQIVSAKLLVQLDGSGSTDTDGNSLSYRWTFNAKPNGSNAELSDSSLVNPTFIADIRGDYLISLVVNDGLVDSNIDSVTYSVVNNTPIANAGTDQAVNTGAVVTLDGSDSSDINGDDLNFRWSFSSRPPGSNASLSATNVVAPTFTADLDGNYVLNLLVDDRNRISEPDQVTITATTVNNNTRPIADAGNDQTINTGTQVTLDGSNSTDGDGNTLTYLWQVFERPSGSTAVLFNANRAKPTFTPDINGHYVFTLVVNDSIEDSDPDGMLIIATNAPPTADAGNDQTITIGSLVNLNGSNSSDPDGNALTYLWTFDTIPNGSNTSLSDRTVANPAFTADVSGDYRLNLVVNDGIEDSGPDTIIITAINTASIANASVDHRLDNGNENGNRNENGWTQGLSYNKQDSWHNIAVKFEFYDVDLCNGHTDHRGNYHHHGFSRCLQDLFNDDGQSHSPIYGYATDGFPIHGPYNAANVLAQSSWQTRDYDNINSTTGCDISGQRNCQLIDQYDISKGTKLSDVGPMTSEAISAINSSATEKTFITTSGYYFEDYYHNADLTASGGAFLDKHNGHNHHNYGYHYHLTVTDNNGTLEPVFPYSASPSDY